MKKGKRVCKVFGITAVGNFEGTNILNLLNYSYDKTLDLNNWNDLKNLDREISEVYNYRKKRTKLHLDDKHLASWNAMMITAMSMLYRVSQKEKYLAAAKGANEFIEKNLCKETQIYTSTRNGKCSEKGFLNDYAFYITALIELYNSTLDIAYLKKAEDFLNETVKKFADNTNGGYFLSETKSNGLFINPKETYDGAMPCGNSIMAYNFVRMYQLTEKDMYKKFAESQIAFMSSKAQNYPSGCSMFLIAKMLYENPPAHITIVLKNSKESISIGSKLSFLANVTVVSESSQYPLLNDSTTYYICKDHTCQPPVNKLVV